MKFHDIEPSGSPGQGLQTKSYLYILEFLYTEIQRFTE